MSQLNHRDRKKLGDMGVPVSRVGYTPFNLGHVPFTVLKSPETFRSPEISPEERAAITSARMSVIERLNQSMRRMDPQGFPRLPFELQSQGHGIWKEVTSLSRMGTLHQQALQNAMALAPGSRFLGLDIETIGEMGGRSPIFDITEIAVEGYIYRGEGSKGVSPIENQSLALAIRPGDPNTIRNWIKQAQRGESLFDYQRRTIESLMRYDDTMGAQIVDGNIVRHATIKTLDELGVNKRPYTETEIASAMRGLDQLSIKGVEKKIAMQRLGDIIAEANKNNMPIMTHNGIQFDIPALQHAFNASESVTKGLANARHIDTLHFLRSWPNVYKSIYGGSRDLPIESLGELQLEQITEFMRRRGAHMPEGIAHHSLSDVRYMAHAFAELMDSPDINLREALNKAQVTEWTNDANPLRLHAGLKFNQQEISPLDIFYSVRGRMARGPHAEDMILRRDGDSLNLVDFPQMSIRRNQFYQFLGYGQTETPQGHRHFAVFNMLGAESGSDDYHVLMARTHGELSESIHQALRPWNRNAMDVNVRRVGVEMDEAGNVLGDMVETELTDKYITDATGRRYNLSREAQRSVAIGNRDHALRRWRRMFSAERGGGFNLLKEALDYAEDPDSVTNLTQEKIRDYSQMAGRLRSEAPLWRSIIEEIEGQNLRTDFEKDLALQIAHEDVMRQLQENEEVSNPLNLTKRRPTILEAHNLPVLDPETKSVSYVSFSDRALAQEGIFNILRQRTSSTRVSEQRRRGMEAEFNRLVRSLSRPHRIIDGEEIIDVPAILSPEAATHLREGRNLDTRINALIDTIMSEQAHLLSRRSMTVETLRPRRYNIADYVDMGSVRDSIRQRLNFSLEGGYFPLTESFKNWIKNYEDNIAGRANIVGNTDIVAQLDRLRRSFTRDGMGVMFGFDDDIARPAIRMILHRIDPDSVASAMKYLASPESQMSGALPSGMAQIDIPLPDKDGVIRVGRMEVLGTSRVTFDRSVWRNQGQAQYLIETPFEQFVSSIARRSPSITRYASSGDVGMAQYQLDRSVRSVIERMSGSSGPFNTFDSEFDLRPRGNLLDIQRRMLLRADDLVEIAATRINEEVPGAIKTDISGLTSEEAWRRITSQERSDILRAIPKIINTEVAEQLRGNVYGVGKSFQVSSLGARASQVERAMYSLMDQGSLYPLADYDKLGRENQLQFMNFRPLIPSAIEEDMVGVNLLQTPEQIAIKRRFEMDRTISGIYAPGIAIDDITIDRLMSDPSLRGDLDFITRPRTYEQQFVISRSFASQFRSMEERSFVVDSLSEFATKGGVFDPRYQDERLALGTVGDKTRHFDLKGIGRITDITTESDGRYRIRMEVERSIQVGTKIAFGGGEKGTVHTIMDDADFERIFGRGPKWAAFLDVAKHEDFGSLVMSQISKGAMAVRRDLIREEQLLEIVQNAFDPERQRISIDAKSGVINFPRDIEINANMITRFHEGLEAAYQAEGNLDRARSLGLTSEHVLPDGSRVLSRVDEVRMADVVEELGASHRFDGSSTSNRMAEIGLREIKSLERRFIMVPGEDGYRREMRRLDATLEWIRDEQLGVDDSLRQRLRREASGLYSAIKHQIGRGDPLGVETLNYRDINLLPAKGMYEEDDIIGTMFDRPRSNASSGSGVFAIKLPEEIRVDLGGRDSARKIDRVYMAHTELEREPTGRYVLNNLQRSQERLLRSLYEYEQYFSNVGPGIEGISRDEALKQIQSRAQSYIDELAKIADSDGLINQKLIKTPISSSGYGRTNIFAPTSLIEEQLRRIGTSEEWIRALQDDNTVFISRQRAREMGIGKYMDQLMDPNKGFFGLSQRFPNIHPDTIAVTRFFVHDSVEGDQVILTPGLAAKLKADSDGDFHAMYFSHRKNVQSELKDHWMLGRETWRNYGRGLVDDYEEFVSSQDINTMLKDGVPVQRLPQHLAFDMEAKLGKTLIGSISNLAHGSADYAFEMQRAGRISQDQLADFLEFTMGIEHRSIGVKHYGAEIENPFRLYHVDDPQEARAVFNIIRGRGEYQGVDVSARRAAFIQRFVDLNPDGTENLFTGKQDLVDNFFNVVSKNERLWEQTTQDILYSSPSRRGLTSVYDTISSATTTPNRRAFLEATGIETGVDLIDDALRSMTDENIISGTSQIGPMDAVRRRSGSAVQSMLERVGSIDMGRAGAIGLAGIGLAAVALRIGSRDRSIDPDSIAVERPAPNTGQPTARVMDNTKGYPGYSVKIRAQDPQGRDPAELAQLVNNGVQDSMPMPLNTSVFVRDDSSRITNEWVQEVFNNALNRGYV